MESWAGPTPLTQEISWIFFPACQLGQLMPDAPISRQMPFVVSTAQEALQLIERKHLGFFNIV